MSNLESHTVAIGGVFSITDLSSGAIQTVFVHGTSGSIAAPHRKGHMYLIHFHYEH